MDHNVVFLQLGYRSVSLQIIVDSVKFREHLIRTKHSILRSSVHTSVQRVIEVMLIDSARLVDRREPTLFKALVEPLILQQFVLALVLTANL